MASSANPAKAFPAVETRNNERVQHLAAALYLTNICEETDSLGEVDVLTAARFPV
jgi:hypothetical protein